MSFTDTDLETALDKISEEIVRMCRAFEKRTGHPITRIHLFRDESNNLGCETEINISGIMVMMNRGEMDS